MSFSKKKYYCQNGCDHCKIIPKKSNQKTPEWNKERKLLLQYD